MNAILASNLYRSSDDVSKSKIRAALQDPRNKELVMQLAEYLDEPITDIDVDTSNPDVEVSNQDELSSVDTDNDTTSTRHRPSTNTPIPKSRNPHRAESNSEPASDFTDSDGTDSEEIDVSVDNSDTRDTVTDETVEESASVSKTRVTASQCIVTCCTPEIVEEIKGTLNHVQDTAGVNRAAIKDNELWLYYDDSINLNSVMDAAIELLNAANYYYLDFNRLARSDNAIVFQIALQDTNSKMQPIQSDGKS